MIWLSPDCLLFQFDNGESIPVTANSISVQVASGDHLIEPEVVQNAAAAVVHYFKDELHRESVTAHEFAGALEKVLHGFGFEVHTADKPDRPTDLAELARLEGGSELAFFPHLRRALQAQLGQAPARIRFHGLRPAVKHLVGAQRWSPRCEILRDQILAFLRGCLSAEPHHTPHTLVVE